MYNWRSSMEVTKLLRGIVFWSILLVSVNSLSVNVSETPDTLVESNLTLATSDQIEEEEENLPIEDVDNDYAEAFQSANITDFTPEGRLTSSTTATVATLNQFPYAVHLSSTIPSSSTARACTGALLTAEYVITLASCVYDATAITVTAATIDFSETPGTTLVVAKPGTATVHPKYVANSYYYDVALVKLQTPYTLGTNIGTINLAYKYNVDDHGDVTGRALRLIGYGSVTANTLTAFELRYESMNVLSKSKCISKMKERNVVPANTQDCLDTDSGTLGACNQADMGGLLVYKFDTDSTATLAGLLNYYYSCGTPTPNLFIRLGPHWDWIRKYVKVYDNIG